MHLPESRQIGYEGRCPEIGRANQIASGDIEMVAWLVNFNCAAFFHCASPYAIAPLSLKRAPVRVLP